MQVCPTKRRDGSHIANKKGGPESHLAISLSLRNRAADSAPTGCLLRCIPLGQAWILSPHHRAA
jgi:hypothetical protein